MENTIIYGEKIISVSKEVAEFLESDRKRQAAEERSDRRHTSKSKSEPVHATAQGVAFSDPTWTSALRNLTLEKLHKVIDLLNPEERTLIHMYFHEKQTMEQIANSFGISKMAISKRLKKLLRRMRELMET